MLTMPEIHGLIIHLPILFVPIVAVLGLLRWKGRGGEAVAQAEPWAFGAAAIGAALAVLSGLIVLGGARQTLRGGAQTLVWVHLVLGLALVVLLAVVGFVRWRRRGRPHLARTVALTGIVGVGLVLVIGYVGGRMVYIHGTGVHAGGEIAQSAHGAVVLASGLARGGDPVALGRDAFRNGFGCASCHGMQAQGKRGPCLSGGVDLDRFRHTHGTGLFPPAIITAKMVGAVNAWLKTDPAGAACRGGG
jgi:uncharacterized membrane protein